MSLLDTAKAFIASLDATTRRGFTEQQQEYMLKLKSAIVECENTFRKLTDPKLDGDLIERATKRVNAENERRTVQQRKHLIMRMAGNIAAGNPRGMYARDVAAQSVAIAEEIVRIVELMPDSHAMKGRP